MILKEIVARRARRAIDPKSVPTDVVDRIMEAAVLAPSCFNNQSWRFVVIDENTQLDKIKEFLSGGNYWARKAPLIVLAATKDDLGCKLSDNRIYALLDVGLASMNLMLQATKEGLYAHPIAGYNPVEIKQIVGIPQDYILIELIILGYPGDELDLSQKHTELEHSPRNRKPIEEVLNKNTWKM
jgi:nitroreductase